MSFKMMGFKLSAESAEDCTNQPKTSFLFMQIPQGSYRMYGNYKTSGHMAQMCRLIRVCHIYIKHLLVFHSSVYKPSVLHK